MTYDLDWMRRRHAEGRWKGIFFWGHRQQTRGRPDKSCCSQWFPAGFDVDGIRYRTAEHWMMAGKARLFSDEARLHAILAAPEPAEAKALGRKVSGFDSDRWSAFATGHVIEGHVHKFRDNPKLGHWLQNTGDRVLVEAAPNDPIWGVALAADDPRIHDPAKWRGSNLLGFALMRVRDILKEEP